MPATWIAIPSTSKITSSSTLQSAFAPSAGWPGLTFVTTAPLTDASFKRSACLASSRFDVDAQVLVAVVMQIFMDVFEGQARTIFLAPVLQCRSNGPAIFVVRDVMAAITAVLRNRLTTDVGQFPQLPLFGREFILPADQFNLVRLDPVGGNGVLPGLQQLRDLVLRQRLTEHRFDKRIQSDFVDQRRVICGRGLKAGWFTIEFQQECGNVGGRIDRAFA